MTWGPNTHIHHVSGRIINRLRQAAGGWVKVSELIEAIYYHDLRDSEPEGATRSLRVMIHTLRGKGFRIENRYGFYRMPTTAIIPLGDHHYDLHDTIGDVILGRRLPRLPAEGLQVAA